MSGFIRIPTLKELKRDEYEANWALAFDGKRRGYMCSENGNRPHDFQMDICSSTVACAYCGIVIPTRD